MLKAGTCLCPNCGEIFTDAFFKPSSGDRLLDITLRYNPFTGKHRLQCSDSAAVVTVSDSLRKARGIPATIQANVDGTSVNLTRYCPKCGNVQTPLPRGYGKVPVFVVLVVGGRATGKSSWLNAVSSPENVARAELNRFPYELEIRDPRQSVGEAKADSTSSFHYIVLRKRREDFTPLEKLTTPSSEDGLDLATVILVDTAGEHWSNNAAMEARLKLFMEPRGNYPGPDALLIMDPVPRKLTRSRWQDEDVTQSASTIRVLQTLMERDLLKNKPVAYVRTRADLLLPAKAPMLEGLITPATFADSIENTSYAPGQMIPRILLQDHIASRLPSQFEGFLSHKNSMSFLVKSCSNEVTREGRSIDVYTENFHIFDPLLWLLNRLGIFPLDRS